MDEQLEVWAKAWGGNPVAHDGNHVPFGKIWMEPQPARPGGPVLWFGGSGLHPRLLARLVRYGGGFNPLGAVTDAELAEPAGAGPSPARRPAG